MFLFLFSKEGLEITDWFERFYARESEIVKQSALIRVS
jgi:hypothetical protein